MIALSAIDQERFGVVAARADGLAAGDVPAALEFCRDHGVALFIARSSTSDLAVAQALERAGGRLTDTLVYFKRSVLRSPLPEHDCKIPIRALRDGDAPAVERVARAAFAGYSGHYHADPRLSRAAVAEVYPSWAWRSCTIPGVATHVLVADDGDIAAFATLKRNGRTEGEGVLFGVAPRVQRAGVYRALMVEALRWCRDAGAEHLLVSTQVSNVAVQKVWVRLGFEPLRSEYTFHLWLADD